MPSPALQLLTVHSSEFRALTPKLQRSRQAVAPHRMSRLASHARQRRCSPEPAQSPQVIQARSPRAPVPTAPTRHQGPHGPPLNRLPRPPPPRRPPRRRRRPQRRRRRPGAPPRPFWPCACAPPPPRASCARAPAPAPARRRWPLALLSRGQHSGPAPHSLHARARGTPGTRFGALPIARQACARAAPPHGQGGAPSARSGARAPARPSPRRTGRTRRR